MVALSSPAADEQLVTAVDVKPGDVLLNTLFEDDASETLFVHDVISYSEKGAIGLVTDCGVKQIDNGQALTRLASRKATLGNGDTCMLATSGVTHTTARAFEWANDIVCAARDWLGHGIVARLWGYRDESLQGFSCDLTDAGNNCFPITLTLAGRNDLQLDDHAADCLVVDGPEAVHLVGMVVRGLGAQLQLGSFDAEGNPDLVTGFAPGRSVGRMRLAGIAG